VQITGTIALRLCAGNQHNKSGVCAENQHNIVQETSTYKYTSKTHYYYGGFLVVGFSRGQEVCQNYKDTRICATHIKIHIPPVLCSTDGGGVFFMFFINISGYEE
jgi:hypothetical protein